MMQPTELEQEEEKVEKIAATDTLALVGFVISLVGFLSGINAQVAWPFDITGIVFSIIGIKSKHWRGFAIAGIILGGLGMIGSSAWFLFLGYVTRKGG